jgi:hypothetical protein
MDEYGTVRPGSGAANCPSCDATRKRTAVHSELGRRPGSLSGAAAGKCREARVRHSGLLPDVQSCSFGAGASSGGQSGCDSEADARTIRDVLEREAWLERACLAGKVLFVPSRRRAPLDSVAVHGAESGACWIGSGTARMAMVERRSTLRSHTGRMALNGTMEPAMGCRQLEEVPRHPGN